MEPQLFNKVSSSDLWPNTDHLLSSLQYVPLINRPDASRMQRYQTMHHVLALAAGDLPQGMAHSVITHTADLKASDPVIVTYELIKSDLEAEVEQDLPTPFDSDAQVPHNVDTTQTIECTPGPVVISAYTPDNWGIV